MCLTAWLTFFTNVFATDKANEPSFTSSSSFRYGWASRVRSYLHHNIATSARGKHTCYGLFLTIAPHDVNTTSRGRPQKRPFTQYNHLYTSTQAKTIPDGVRARLKLRRKKTNKQTNKKPKPKQKQKTKNNTKKLGTTTHARPSLGHSLCRPSVCMPAQQLYINCYVYMIVSAVSHVRLLE